MELTILVRLHPATANFRMLAFVVVYWGTVEALESFGALLRLHDRWTDFLFPSGNYLPWYYIANHSKSIMAFVRYIMQISNCAAGHFLISSQRCTWYLFSKGCWSCNGQFIYLFVLFGSLWVTFCMFCFQERIRWAPGEIRLQQQHRFDAELSESAWCVQLLLHPRFHTCPFRQVYIHTQHSSHIQFSELFYFVIVSTIQNKYCTRTQIVATVVQIVSCVSQCESMWNHTQCGVLRNIMICA